MEQRNKFSVGETVEIMKRNGENQKVTVRAIYNDAGERMESAPHPKQSLYINVGTELNKYDIIRRAEENK